MMYKILPFAPNYKIFSNGDVFSIISNKILKPIERGNGYLCCTLYYNMVSKIYSIHRLVAIAFLPNDDNKPQVNHINGIKTDNRVENLEWCNGSENIKHALENGLSKTFFKGKLGEKSAKRKKIIQKDLIGNEIGVFWGAREAERKTSIKYSSITNVCNNKRKTAGGFKWEYFK